MRAGVSRLVAAVLLCVLCIGSPAARAQESTSGSTDQVVDLINRTRVNAGLSPLARSTELDSAAQAHSMDMVQHDYLDHTGSDGSQPQDRADKAGYHVPPNSGWIVVEVISAISGDPQGPVNWWMGDDLHRKVLMNPRWREIGAGYAQGGEYGNYWTALFGCRPGVLPTVVLDAVTYTSTEQCGDPSVGASLAPTATVQPTATLVPSPTVVPTSIPTSVPPSARVSTEQSGQAVTVSWSGITGASATDWFGVYRPQDPDTSFQDWDYVSCSKAPDRPRDSGKCTLSLPTISGGAYEIRLFSSNGYTRMARSDVLTAASGNLNVRPLTVQPGAVVNVQWRGVSSASPTDWIGLYSPGGSDAAPVAWQYVGCAQVPLDARPLGSCNVVVPGGLAPGSYEFRLFASDGYTRLAAPSMLQVQ